MLVFISYSHKDHRYLEPLTTTYLAVLENEKLIRHWTDGEIRAGEDWNKCIREEMNSADIVLLLLSEHFFASRYIRGVEMKLARKRHAKGEAKIIPVLLGGKTWERHAWLKKLEMVPKTKEGQNLVPLLDFPPRQAAGWEVVQAQLRKVIETMRKKRPKTL
ncbi:MAG: toll/interleukin-1 receptor domain-containing protein [Verrucomicrobiia bacterium]